MAAFEGLHIKIEHGSLLSVLGLHLNSRESHELLSASRDKAPTFGGEGTAEYTTTDHVLYYYNRGLPMQLLGSDYFTTNVTITFLQPS